MASKGTSGEASGHSKQSEKGEALKNYSCEVSQINSVIQLILAMIIIVMKNIFMQSENLFMLLSTRAFLIINLLSSNYTYKHSQCKIKIFVLNYIICF